MGLRVRGSGVGSGRASTYVVGCVFFVERGGTRSFVCMRMCKGRRYLDKRLFFSHADGIDCQLTVSTPKARVVQVS
jgi:hypothetical protein